MSSHSARPDEQSFVDTVSADTDARRVVHSTDDTHAARSFHARRHDSSHTAVVQGLTFPRAMSFSANLSRLRERSKGSDHIAANPNKWIERKKSALGNAWHKRVVKCVCRAVRIVQVFRLVQCLKNSDEAASS